MRLVTRSSLKRLAVLFALIGIFLLWAGWAMIWMPGKSFRGSLPPLTTRQKELSAELRAHVEKFGGEIGERNVYIPNKLRAAADYIESTFTNAGYRVSRQSYTVLTESCDNLEVEIPGKGRSNEIVIIGAHYDSVLGSPGANDNGSGIAAVLALARAWAGRESSRTVRFVGFVNEEPPFFQTEQMGSLVYAKHCRERGDKIVAMLSLETMGYYSDAEDSQRYPFPAGLFYPSRGNFSGFVGNTSNGKLVRRCLKVFRAQASFPSEGGALYGGLPGVGWSDQWAFWQVGYPGIMVTDTATFRYPHYHEEEDRPEKLDYDRFARVVDGLVPVMEELVGSNR